MVGTICSQSESRSDKMYVAIYGVEHANIKIIPENNRISQNLTTVIAYMRNRHNETFHLFPSPLYLACSDTIVTHGLLCDTLEKDCGFIKHIFK